MDGYSRTHRINQWLSYCIGGGTCFLSRVYLLVLLRLEVDIMLYHGMVLFDNIGVLSLNITHVFTMATYFHQHDAISAIVP